MPKNVIYKIYGISFTLSIIMLFVFVYLNHHLNGSVWQSMQQSKSALTAEYCELDQTTHFFRQTMNTYSNLMYFFLGMIVVLISFYDAKNTKQPAKNAIQQFPMISLFFGCCLIYLSAGSAFFHASLTWIGQRVDMNGTYSICISLIGISLYRYFSDYNIFRSFISDFKNQLFVIILLAVIIAAFIKLHLLISSTVLLPLLMTVAVSFTLINYNKNKTTYQLSFAILSLLLTVCAFVLRTLDVKKIACDPTSIYQGHALWHLFTGMSAFLLYWFYRSEQTEAKKTEW